MSGLSIAPRLSYRDAKKMLLAGWVARRPRNSMGVTWLGPDGQAKRGAYGTVVKLREAGLAAAIKADGGFEYRLAKKHREAAS